MSYRKQVMLGAFLAVAAYSILFGAITPAISTAYAATQPLFTVTLLAPTSNPVRRQYASIIATSFQQVGINAQLVYVGFSQLIPRLFFGNAANCTQAGATYANGGYDIGFIGWGSTSVVPDGWLFQYLGTCNNMAPVGNNYYLYNNTQVNNLINQIETTTNLTLAKQLTWQVQAIVKNDSPNDVIYYTNWVIARAPNIQDYGGNNTWNEVTFPDVQHYSGVTTLSFAEAGNVFPDNNLNPLPVISSSSFYALFMYAPTLAGLQEIDTRKVQAGLGLASYYLALANSIKSSPDGTLWNISFKPHTFQDGVPVTGDDFVFTFESLFNPFSNYVGVSSMLIQLGNVGHFTFSSPSVAQFVYSHLNGTNPVTPSSGISISGSTITIDQSAGGAKTNFYVTATGTNSFSIQIPKPYSFLNQTWTTIAPLPMHYLGFFAPSGWSQLPYSTASGPDTYPNGTVVKAVDPGGSWNGKPISGPFSNGPYIFTGFDSVTNTAHLVQFNNYWNASGLRAIGQFTVTQYNVVWISGADSAIAAFRNGQVNQLDTNYALAPYINQLRSIGANVITGGELGFQEMGINMRHPVFGTGAQTPAGQANPAKAAQAARDVRRAFSYLIPRQLIVNSLLVGLGVPGATDWAPPYSDWVNPNVQADPYNPQLAVQLLQQAGYSAGISTPPPPPPSLPPQQFVLGPPTQPITLSGNLTIPGTIRPIVGANLSLQFSYDNVTWQDSGKYTVTSSTGFYNVSWVPPYPGTVYVRLALVPTYTVLVKPTAHLEQYGLVNLSNYVSNALQGYATSQQVAGVQQSVNSLSGSVQQLTAQISSLQQSLNTVTYVAYGSIVVAILAILVAIFVSARKR